MSPWLKLLLPVATICAALVAGWHALIGKDVLTGAVGGWVGIAISFALIALLTRRRYSAPQQQTYLVAWCLHQTHPWGIIGYSGIAAVKAIDPEAAEIEVLHRMPLATVTRIYTYQ